VIGRGLLNVNNINKTGGNTTTVETQMVSSVGRSRCPAGTLRLGNNLAGAGANNITSTAVNVSGSGNLRLDLAVGAAIRSAPTPSI